jgi:hypothetical protein
VPAGLSAVPAAFRAGSSRKGQGSRVVKPLIALTVVLAALAAGPAVAAPDNPQGQARKEMRAGNVRSLREIEQQVLPMMKGMQYLGPEYDPAAVAYRLKFIQNGRVVFVDVDARTGEVLRQVR